MDGLFVVDVSLLRVDQSAQSILWNSLLTSKLDSLDDVLPNRCGRRFLHLRIRRLFRRFLTLWNSFKRIRRLLRGWLLRGWLLRCWLLRGWLLGWRLRRLL